MIPKVIHKVVIVDEGKMPQLPEDMNRARMNPEILNAFNENPYTQSLTSSVY